MNTIFVKVKTQLKFLILWIYFLIWAFIYIWIHRFGYLNNGDRTSLIIGIALGLIACLSVLFFIKPINKWHYQIIFKLISGYHLYFSSILIGMMAYAAMFSPISLSLTAWKVVSLCLLVAYSSLSIFILLQIIKRNGDALRKEVSISEMMNVSARMSEIVWDSYNVDHLNHIVYKKFYVPLAFILAFLYHPVFILFLIYFLIAMIAMSGRAIRPPLALFLTGDFEKSKDLLRTVRTVAGEHKVSHLLVDKQENAVVANDTGVDSLRVFGLYRGFNNNSLLDWKSVVSDLMVFSKVVIIDCRNYSSNLIEEIQIAARLDIFEKCLMVGSPDLVTEALAKAGLDQLGKQFLEVHQVEAQQLPIAFRERIAKYSYGRSCWIDELHRLRYRSL